MQYRIIVGIGSVVTGFALLPIHSHAAGKRRPASQPPAPAAETATPVRHVVLQNVATQPFVLPNGARIDMTADLNAILRTVVTETPTLAPLEGGGAHEPCDTHLEIRATVSTVELNVSELGLRFGYTPSGGIGTVTGATGELNVRTGVIAMDFSVWECVGEQCVAVAASTASKRTSRTEAGIRVDFGAIGTGAGFITQTAFGALFRDLMRQGVGSMASSARLNELAWSAVVRDYDASTGRILFDRGASDRLKAGQDFVVYQGAVSDGRCGVFRPLAYIHTERVDTESSLGIVTESLDSRRIEPGDLVLVRMR